jgi:hypothetical protein
MNNDFIYTSDATYKVNWKFNKVTKEESEPTAIRAFDNTRLKVLVA